MKSLTSPRDIDLPPDLSSNQLVHPQFSERMNQNLHRHLRIRPFANAVKEVVSAFIQRFRWKSGLGVALICCGIICSGYLFCSIDGSNTILTAAAAFGGCFRMQPRFISINIDYLHQHNRSLLGTTTVRTVRSVVVDGQELTPETQQAFAAAAGAIGVSAIIMMILLSCVPICCCCLFCGGIIVIIYLVTRNPSSHDNDAVVEPPVEDMV